LARSEKALTYLRCGEAAASQFHREPTTHKSLAFEKSPDSPFRTPPFIPPSYEKRRKI
jgi:hypothetical protein